MTDPGYGQPRPNYTTPLGQGATYPAPGNIGYGAPPPPPAQDVAPSSKGFLSSLFDFGFTSFVTPTVVKVVYVLIMVLLGLASIGFAVSAFTVSTAFGVIALFILCPLFFFVYLALWRILLEIFMVIFRIADDLRAIRSNGGMR